VLLIVFTVTTVTPPSLAADLTLPKPDVLLAQSAAFTPVILKGMVIHPEDPLMFDFLMDTGTEKPSGEALRREAEKSIKYFLASLTVPENDLWVNLSPYEKDRVIPDAFGKTVMGRDLLGEDYILKQLASSLLYPESDLGKEFWSKVYAEAAKNGVSDIDVSAFNRVWIVPSEAQVWEHDGKVVILRSHLKVMLESDYVAAEKVQGTRHQAQEAQVSSGAEEELAKGIMRSILVPAVEREVNEGANFARLRQVYAAMILSAWYKIRLKESLLGKAYADQNKVTGVEFTDGANKEEIYNQYLAAARKGVFNYIREENDPATGDTIPRKYFSGGFDSAMLNKVVSTGLLIGALAGLPSAARAEALSAIYTPSVVLVSAGVADVGAGASTGYLAQARQSGVIVAAPTISVQTDSAMTAGFWVATALNALIGFGWGKGNLDVSSNEVRSRLSFYMSGLGILGIGLSLEAAALAFFYQKPYEWHQWAEFVSTKEFNGLYSSYWPVLKGVFVGGASGTLASLSIFGATAYLDKIQEKKRTLRLTLLKGRGYVGRFVERNREPGSTQSQPKKSANSDSAMANEVSSWKKISGALGLNWLAYRALKSGDPVKQLEAFRYFAERNDKRAIGLIAETLRGGGGVRIVKEANEALHKLGVDKELVFQANTSAIDSRFETSRTEAIEWLGESADPRSIEAIAVKLGDKSSGVRTAASEALRKLGANSELVFQAYVKVINSADKSARIDALRWLGETGDRRAIKAVSRGLASYYLDERSAAKEVLNKLKTSQEEWFEAYQNALNFTDEYARLEALRWFGESGDQRAIGIVAGKLGSWPKEHLAAKEALNKLRASKEEWFQAYQHALIESSEWSDDIKIEALQWIGEYYRESGDRRAISLIVQMLENKHTSVITTALNLLVKFNEKSAIEPIASLLNYQSSDIVFVRNTASDALYALGDPRGNYLFEDEIGHTEYPEGALTSSYGDPTYGMSTWVTDKPAHWVPRTSAGTPSDSNPDHAQGDVSFWKKAAGAQAFVKPNIVPPVSVHTGRIPMILLTGMPSAGKSTTGEMLSRELGIPYVSAGALLREEALFLRQPINNDPRNVARAEKDYLARNIAKLQNGFILDYHPMSEERQWLTEEALASSGFEVAALAYVDIDQKIAQERELQRPQRPEAVGTVEDRVQAFLDRIKSDFGITEAVLGRYREAKRLVTIDNNSTREDLSKNVAAASAQLQPVMEEKLRAARSGKGVLNGAGDDAAMKDRNAVPKDLGGIDLDAKKLDLQIKRDGKGVALPVDQQDWSKINIQGFIPVIYKIEPIDMGLILGLNKDGQPLTGNGQTLSSTSGLPQGREMEPVGI